MKRKQYIEPAIAVITSPELMQTQTLPMGSPHPGGGENPDGADGKGITDVVEDDDDAFPAMHDAFQTRKAWKD